jgi:hypothetical protein
MVRSHWQFQCYVHGDCQRWRISRQAIFSVFSPNSNATGGFVGWEGLNQNGFSESPFDIHQGQVTDRLADISLGVPPVPEPSTWAMMILGFMAYRRKSKPALMAA